MAWPTGPSASLTEKHGVHARPSRTHVYSGRAEYRGHFLANLSVHFAHVGCRRVVVAFAPSFDDTAGVHTVKYARIAHLYHEFRHGFYAGLAQVNRTGVGCEVKRVDVDCYL